MTVCVLARFFRVSSSQIAAGPKPGLPARCRGRRRAFAAGDTARRNQPFYLPQQTNIAQRNTIPRTDAKFLNWSANFGDLIAADAAGYGLSDKQAADFNALLTAFRASYAKAVEPGTKTTVAVAQKNADRDALRLAARRLVSIIDGQANVTDAQRVALGIVVRDASPTPVPRPSNPPLIEVQQTVGNSVTIRLLDSRDTSRRGKPAAAIGATVFSFVGDVAPAEENGWTFEGNTSKTTLTVQFAQLLPPGTKVWFTAIWYNRKAQSGPPAAPVTCNLPGGSAMAKAA